MKFRYNPLGFSILESPRENGKVLCPCLTPLVNRKNDPNYQQISAYIDKDLAIRFRQLLASKSCNISEGLEEALRLYLETAEKTRNNPAKP